MKDLFLGSAMGLATTSTNIPPQSKAMLSEEALKREARGAEATGDGSVTILSLLTAVDGGGEGAVTLRELLAGPLLRRTAAKGGLQIVGEGFSASERATAQELASQGRNVVLRQADSAAGRTSDLLLDGIPYDVYTPTTGNLSRIVSAIASKGSQVRGGGVVLDLSKSPLTPGEVGNILPRVQGVTDQISDIIVMGGGD